MAVCLIDYASGTFPLAAGMGWRIWVATLLGSMETKIPWAEPLETLGTAWEPPLPSPSQMNGVMNWTCLLFSCVVLASGLIFCLPSDWRVSSL